MNVLGNATYLGLGVSSPFQAFGGTEPYTYKVACKDCGETGTIDSEGLYTAPMEPGQDEIIVTDAAGLTATIKVSYGTVLHILADIIQREMGLDDGRVYLYNQKIFQPTDKGLVVVVQEIGCKPFANTNQFDGATNEQVQSTNFLAMVQLDIMSVDLSALLRKEEMLMALASQYAESQQELNSFMIGKLPVTFTNISSVDGAAIPYRFSVTINVQYQVTKRSSVSYFSQFQPVSVITGP